jgi:hypothetical protein
MISFAKTPLGLGGPTLPLPPFLSLPLHSATLSTTSSKEGGRMPKNRDEDDSGDAPNDDCNATHAVGWTAPLPFHLMRHRPHPPRRRRRGSLVTPFSSLHRLSPFDALIINEGGGLCRRASDDDALSRRSFSSFPSMPANLYSPLHALTGISSKPVKLPSDGTIDCTISDHRG